MSNEIDYKFKIIIIGEIAVGKTSLIRRYVDGKFSESYIPTIRTDFTVKDIHYKGKNIRLLLYELGGHNHFKKDQKRHFKMVNYIVVVASVSRDEKKSIEMIPAIIDNVIKITKEMNDINVSVPIVLILNKVDLINSGNRNIIFYNYKRLIKHLTSNFDTKGILFTSAKTGEGVDVMFNKIATELLRNV